MTPVTRIPWDGNEKLHLMTNLWESMCETIPILTGTTWLAGHVSWNKALASNWLTQATYGHRRVIARQCSIFIPFSGNHGYSHNIRHSLLKNSTLHPMITMSSGPPTRGEKTYMTIENSILAGTIGVWLSLGWRMTLTLPHKFCRRRQLRQIMLLINYGYKLSEVTHLLSHMCCNIQTFLSLFRHVM